MVDYHPGDLVVKNVPSRSGWSKSSQVLLVIEVGHSIKLKKPLCKVMYPDGSVRTYFSYYFKKL